MVRVMSLRTLYEIHYPAQNECMYGVYSKAVADPSYDPEPGRRTRGPTKSDSLEKIWSSDHQTADREIHRPLGERVDQIRRGSVQTFQDVLRSAEIAQRQREAPSQGHAIVWRRRMEQQIGPVVRKAMTGS